MKYLVIIPARGGSKGIPGKNIKPLNGVPLIQYTIDAAKAVASEEDICVSTDDDRIIQVVEEAGLKIPFKRPASLATDEASAEAVIMHALDFYERRGQCYELVILLQPTSPFRTGDHVRDALEMFSQDVDMLVSVKETESNPYYVLFEENEHGYLKSSKKTVRLTQRQEAPKVYELNGAIYIFKTESLEKYRFMADFPKTTKYLMNAADSIDIDSPLDWEFAEFIIKRKENTY